MKILHINTESGWRGGERQTLLTLEGLKDRGIWAGLVAQPNSPLALKASETSVPLYPISMRGPLDLTVAPKLRRVIKRESVDIVHAQTSHAASLAILSRGFGRKPRLVVSRRVDFPIGTARKYNRFDAIIAISDAIRSILIECGVREDLIHTIPSGIKTTTVRRKSADNLRSSLAGNAEFVIATIGHLTDHKGHRFLIEAMPQVLEEFPDTRLLIIGDGELREDLENRARFFEIEQSVVFAGFRDDAADLIYAFDLYVQPSILEGLCSTLFDVMVRRVPIVATDAGGIPEALDGGKYGSIVSAGQPKELAEAIIEMLKDKKLRLRSLDDAEEWVKSNFSAVRMVERTKSLYERLLEK